MSKTPSCQWHGFPTIRKNLVTENYVLSLLLYIAAILLNMTIKFNYNNQSQTNTPVNHVVSVHTCTSNILHLTMLLMTVHKSKHWNGNINMICIRKCFHINTRKTSWSDCTRCRSTPTQKSGNDLIIHSNPKFSVTEYQAWLMTWPSPCHRPSRII